MVDPVDKYGHVDKEPVQFYITWNLTWTGQIYAFSGQFRLTWNLTWTRTDLKISDVTLYVPFLGGKYPEFSLQFLFWLRRLIRICRIKNCKLDKQQENCPMFKWSNCEMENSKGTYGKTSENANHNCTLRKYVWNSCQMLIFSVWPIYSTRSTYILREACILYMPHVGHLYVFDI